VIGVVMGEDDPAQVFDAMIPLRESGFERGERRLVFRPGVNQRKRIALGQVHVHRPDGEGDGER
jgi:hypothetical protein